MLLLLIRVSKQSRFRKVIRERRKIIYVVAPLADELLENDMLGKTLTESVISKEASWYGVACQSGME